jgi:hypothetical protein
MICKNCNQPIPPESDGHLCVACFLAEVYERMQLRPAREREYAEVHERYLDQRAGNADA